jgi:hypothetical protein
MSRVITQLKNEKNKTIQKNNDDGNKRRVAPANLICQWDN